jgi:hypothetical protein
MTPYRYELHVSIRDSKHLPPEKNYSPLAIDIETLSLPSINQLDGLSAQPAAYSKHDDPGSGRYL